MRKRVRRGLKEGDPGYLKSASETDSAMEDSGSDSGSEEGDDEADGDDNAAEIDGDVKLILEELSKEASLQPALKWLKTSLNDEMEDRMEDDDENIIAVSLVPIFQACTQSIGFGQFDPWTFESHQSIHPLSNYKEPISFQNCPPFLAPKTS